jgi:hypothetical protein
MLTIKAFDQLYAEMKDRVTYASGGKITDFNVGSVIRSLLEAAALNDFELYLGLAQLKQFNNINAVFGDDLDERAVEFNLTRLPPTPSIASVVFSLPNTITAASTVLSTAVTAGSTPTSLVVASTSGFPSSGFLVIDRGYSMRERVRYTGKAATSFTLATDAFAWNGNSPSPTFNHSVGAVIRRSTLDNGVDLVIPAGASLTAPPTLAEPAEVRFSTNAVVTILDGDTASSAVACTSQASGLSQNVSAGRINVIDSTPLNGLLVTNPTGSVGGDEVESDIKFKSRLALFAQSRYGGTAYAIEQAVNNLTYTDPLTGSVATCRLAQLVESFSPELYPSYLYVHDGSDSLTYKTTGSVTTPEALISNAASGQRRGRTKNRPLLSGSLASPSLRLMLAVDRTEPASKRGFGSGVVSGRVLTDGSKSWTTSFVGYKLVDRSNNFFDIVASNSNSVTVDSSTVLTPSSGPYALINPAGAPVAFGDYVANYSSGEIELVSSLALQAGEWLVAIADPAVSGSASYTYYTGLIAEVQAVLNGKSDDPENYPGVKSFGCAVYAREPTLSFVNVVVSTTTGEGVLETQEQQNRVAAAVRQYFGELAIGGSLIYAELLARCQQVSGVYDTQVVSPSANVQALPGQLLRLGTLTIQ